MGKHILGIDFQINGIAWVVVRRGLRRVDIDSSGWLSFSDIPDDEGNLSSALAALRGAVGPRELTSAAALSVGGTICRTSQAPFRDRSKIRQMLPLDLEPTLSVAADDLAFDFQITNHAAPADLLSLATERSRRDTILTAMREAGFDPELLTLQGLPSAFLLARQVDTDTTTLLVDGDHDRVLFFWLQEGIITFIRNWKSPGGSEPPEVILGHGIRQTLEAFACQSARSVELDQVVLTARAADHYDGDRLAEASGLSITPLDLRKGIATNMSGGWPDDRCQGALALCLYTPQAESGLNFYRSAFPINRFVLQNKPHFLRIATLSILFVGLFIANLALDNHRSRVQLNALNQTAREILTTTFPDTRNVVDPLQQMMVNLRQTRSEASFPGNHKGPLKIDLLNDLSRSLPPHLDIRLTQLVVGREQLQIVGNTATFETVNQAQSLLAKQPVFDQLTIVSANMDPTLGRVRFKLAADYQGF